MPRSKKRAVLRRRITFHMDESAKLWMFKTAHSQFWRVMAWYDLESLIQDGYVCYQLIRRRYPTAIDRPHIMQLFKRTYTNHIHQLARKKRYEYVEVANSDVVNATTEMCSDSEMQIALAEAPQIIKDIVTALSVLTDVADETEAQVRPDGTRETTNEWLCRLVGLDPDNNDVHGFLLEYLRPATS